MSTALANAIATPTPAKTATAKKIAEAPKPRVLPWADLPANPDMQKPPREKTTMSAVLNLLNERKQQGATLVELQKVVDDLGLEGTHEIRQLLRWMSANRGWGFHMKKDEHVVLVTKADEKK